MSEFGFSNTISNAENLNDKDKEKSFSKKPYESIFGFTNYRSNRSDKLNRKKALSRENQEVERVSRNLSMSLMTEMAIISFMINGEPPKVKRKLRDNLEELWISYGQRINYSRFSLWGKRSYSNISSRLFSIW